MIRQAANQRHPVIRHGNSRQDTIKDTMNYYETIILCQPDSNKSCSACCGLFNFKDISKDNLTRFLELGAARSAKHITDRDETDQGDGREIRDPTSYICPHQGLLYNKRPGCLLHPQYRTDTLRDRSFFGETICSGFLCPAHALLTIEQKKRLIGLVDDWYLYTVAVIDPESTAWILTFLSERHPIVFQREEVLKTIFNELLTIHARNLARNAGPVFHYSLSEYEMAKKKYSLAADTADTGEEKREMSDIIEWYL